MTDIRLSPDVIAAVFTEWDRRYREDPTGFWTAVEHLLHNTPETYGERAAAYFLHVLGEAHWHVEARTSPDLSD